MNEGNKLILITHSPYLLDFLTLAVKAGNLKSLINTEKQRQDLHQTVPLDAVINTSSLSVYELDDKNGAIKRLETCDGLPSDENALNNNFDETNELFAKLLELQQQWT